MMKNVTSFEQKVASYLEKERLFTHDDKLLVALSGGADSVALLRALHRMGYRCVAAHCNFHLRGDESDRDEHFCRTLCHQQEVELHVTHFDTEGYARLHGVSIEMAARELRYAWFDTLCHSHGYTHVVVAHHRDDNVETLLLNLIRGTGLAGLTGIPPKNGLVVRPLLGVSRGEIIHYLEALGQPFVTDSTNLQDEFVRNNIRLNLIPLLETMNPCVREKLAATIGHLRGVASIYADAVAHAIRRVAGSDGRSVSIPALLREVDPQAVLFEMLRPFGFVPAQVDELCRCLTGDSGKRFFSDDWEVLKDRDTLLIRPRSLQSDGQPVVKVPCLPAELPLSDGTVLHARRQPFAPGDAISRLPLVATLDAAKVCLPLVVRRWQQGDKFAPFGMKGRKKLVSDLLTDMKLSLYDKESQLVVEDADGRIVWVVGRRTDELARVTEQTTDIIVLEIKV